MSEPVTFDYKMGLAKLHMALTDERLTITGIARLDIPLSDLRYFCLAELDQMYKWMLVISYTAGAKVKSKKIYLMDDPPAFRQFLAALEAKRPDASLLNMNPDDAMEKMGAKSFVKSLDGVTGGLRDFRGSMTKWIFIIIAVMVGVVIIAAILAAVIRK